MSTSNAVPVATKRCSRCKAVKGVYEFGRDRSRTDGLQHRCRPCQREAERRWKAANPERVRESNRVAARRYRTANPERVRESNRERVRRYRQTPEGRDAARRYRQTPEGRAANRANVARYRQTPEGRAAIYANVARRRALKKACESNLTPAELELVKAIYADAAFLSEWLGTPMHVDHVIPLARGGTHHPSNLRIIPAALNISKQDRLDDECDADLRRHLPRPEFVPVHLT